jgi:hypothetical protein
MKNKTIIGFIGDCNYCKKASSVLHGIGFHKVSIGKKVLEISKYIMGSKDEDLDEAFLLQVRNRGYKINRLYWINLVLASVPDDKKLVVIEDLRIEDIVKDVISPYYITSDKKNDCPSDIEIIEKTKDIEEFKALIERKFKS